MSNSTEMCTATMKSPHPGGPAGSHLNPDYRGSYSLLPVFILAKDQHCVFLFYKLSTYARITTPGFHVHENKKSSIPPKKICPAHRDWQYYRNNLRPTFVPSNSSSIALTAEMMLAQHVAI